MVYPPDKDYAPLTVQLKIFPIFKKIRSLKKMHAHFLVVLTFQYKTDTYLGENKTA